MFFILFKSVGTSANLLMSSSSNPAFKAVKSKAIQRNEIILYVHGLVFNAESIANISFDQFLMKTLLKILFYLAILTLSLTLILEHLGFFLIS